MQVGADVLLICHKEDQIVEAYEAVSAAVEQDSRLAAKVRKSSERINRHKKRFAKILAPVPRPTSAKVEKLSRALWEFGERVRLVALSREGGA